MTPTREQVIEAARAAGLHNGEHWPTIEARMTMFAGHFYSAGRLKGLDEAKEAFSISEHMHARNNGLMLCVSDLSAVILRMVNGIDHLSEIARQWEPDHSSGAERRRWLLAQYARDDALKLLKEHADAIDQLKEQTP